MGRISHGKGFKKEGLNGNSRMCPSSQDTIMSFRKILSWRTLDISQSSSTCMARLSWSLFAAYLSSCIQAKSACTTSFPQECRLDKKHVCADRFEQLLRDFDIRPRRAWHESRTQGQHRASQPDSAFLLAWALVIILLAYAMPTPPTPK